MNKQQKDGMTIVTYAINGHDVTFTFAYHPNADQIERAVQDTIALENKLRAETEASGK
jgi:hypothetical protein